MGEAPPVPADLNRCRQPCSPTWREALTRIGMMVRRWNKDSRSRLTAIISARDEGNTRWLADCILSDTGKPSPVSSECADWAAALWPDTFAYDEMLCAAVLLKPLKGENSFMVRTVTDIDVGIVRKSGYRYWASSASPRKRYIRRSTSDLMSESFIPFETISMHWSGTAPLASRGCSRTTSEPTIPPIPQQSVRCS